MARIKAKKIEAGTDIKKAASMGRRRKGIAMHSFTPHNLAALSIDEMMDVSGIVDGFSKGIANIGIGNAKTQKIANSIIDMQKSPATSPIARRQIRRLDNLILSKSKRQSDRKAGQALYRKFMSED